MESNHARNPQPILKYTIPCPGTPLILLYSLGLFPGYFREIPGKTPGETPGRTPRDTPAKTPLRPVLRPIGNPVRRPARNPIGNSGLHRVRQGASTDPQTRRPVPRRPQYSWAIPSEISGKPLEEVRQKCQRKHLKNPQNPPVTPSETPRSTPPVTPYETPYGTPCMTPTWL